VLLTFNTLLAFTNENKVKPVFVKYARIAIIPLTLIFSGLSVAGTTSPTVMQEVKQIQADWAKLYYLEDFQDSNIKELQALENKASDLSTKYPNSAEALTWDAIVLSTLAEKKGGLGALSLVEEAKKKLEAAETIDPTALGGSIYASLGTLYWKVPGWPIAFGSNSKAEQYFKKALEINPDQLDANYFYADFLADDKRYELALLHLDKAMHAPTLEGRSLADKGRRAQVQKLRERLTNLDLKIGQVTEK